MILQATRCDPDGTSLTCLIRGVARTPSVPGSRLRFSRRAIEFTPARGVQRACVMGHVPSCTLLDSLLRLIEAAMPQASIAWLKFRRWYQAAAIAMAIQDAFGSLWDSARSDHTVVMLLFR